MSSLGEVEMSSYGSCSVDDETGSGRGADGLESEGEESHLGAETGESRSRVLISVHDDATSRLMMAHFVERDDGPENREAVIGYLRRHGGPPGGLHGPRRTLRSVADEEGGADRHDHLTSVGRVGGRGDPGGLSPGEGASRTDLRHGAGPPDQGDAGGGDLHPRREPLPGRATGHARCTPALAARRRSRDPLRRDGDPQGGPRPTIRFKNPYRQNPGGAGPGCSAGCRGCC